MQILCQRCTEILQEFEILEQNYFNLKHKIIRQYNKSAKENNISEIEFADNNILYEGFDDDDDDDNREFINSVIEYQEHDIDDNDENNQINNIYEEKENIIQNDETISQSIVDNTQNLLTIATEIIPSINEVSSVDLNNQNDEQSNQMFENIEDNLIEFIGDDGKEKIKEFSHSCIILHELLKL